MSKATHVTLALGLVGAAFVGVACRDAVTPEEMGQPSFTFEPPPPPEKQECPELKMTGGGRIDFPPGGPDKNPPASHEYQTFGAHVIQGLDQDGNCVRKGSLQWVDHRLGERVNGRPLNLHSVTIDFAEDISGEFPWTRCDDGAVRWGGTLEVKNTGAVREFVVEDCDNGEPGATHDAFEINVPGLDYFVRCDDRREFEDPPGCVLTGGNRQFH